MDWKIVYQLTFSMLTFTFRRKKIVFSKILFFSFLAHGILLTLKGVRLSKIQCQFVNRIFYTSIWLHLRLSYGFTFQIEFIKRQLELMAHMAKKRPQSIFIEFHWLQECIWLKPPSNSFKVDYLLCVGQTPNIALSISPSPATTQKTEKKVTYYWPSKILELRLSLWKQAGRWLKPESYCLALKLRETYSMFQVKRQTSLTWTIHHALSDWGHFKRRVLVSLLALCLHSQLLKGMYQGEKVNT